MVSAIRYSKTTASICSRPDLPEMKNDDVKVARLRFALDRFYNIR